MTDARRTELVRSSWAKAWSARDVVGGLFYGHLFRLAPETRDLFGGDMTAQARKLTDTLGFVIDRLDAPQDTGPAAAALARRHLSYGAKPEHYAAVGEALLKALRDALGPQAFDAETRDAWAAVYADLCATMLAAAAEAEGGTDRS